ncbi:hypothetical protein QTP86_023606 [Hemibagrus guttatus]|nr:hypothetical protein QTP86_023606 [Hemibagrus guttatus]
MAAAANVIPLGLLHMRPFQFWLRSVGFHPHRHPLDAIRVMRHGLRTLLMWIRPRFMALGPTLGVCHYCRTLSMDASLLGWGAVLDGHPAQGLWEGPQLSWHINCLEMRAVFLALKLSPKPQGLPCAGLINREADFVSRQVLRPGEWRVYPQVVESIWRIYGQVEVDLFASEESTVILPLSSSPSGCRPGRGCVCMPFPSAPTSPSQNTPQRGLPPSSGSTLARSSLVHGPCLPPRQHSLGDLLSQA